MKFKRIIFSLCAAVALLAVACFSACVRSVPDYVQNLNYVESTQKINNPDQGFYRPIYVKLTESGAAFNKGVITEATQLYHLRIDISAFSAAAGGADKELTQEALSGFDGLLSYLRTMDKNAIVRFAYDPGFNGGANKEAGLQTMLAHVGQVCSVMNKYPNTVTAVEVGLIGPWGEMHTSTAAKPENIKQLTEAFLDNTEGTPVLVRTPKMIYGYLGIQESEAEGYRIGADEKAYRLGLFNDGYLGSSTDLGTYSDRTRDVEFLSGQTAHLPFGGEVVIPDSPLHDIDKCTPEMFKLNLSYLNVEWNWQVIDKWKNSTYTRECGSDEIYYGSTAFDYIQNHMGYRFVLTGSTFKYASAATELQVDLTLKNVGFGNLNRTKQAKLIFTDESGEEVFAADVQNFTGENKYGCSLDLNLPEGEYGVYLRVYGEEFEGKPLYCVQFANDGLWNAQLKANKIGSITVA